MVKFYSVVMDIEIDDEDGMIDFPTLEELEKNTKRMVKEYFAAEVDIEVSEGTLEEAFGIVEDE